MIDTGSSYITGPASSVSELMTTIGAQLDESGVSSDTSDAPPFHHTHTHTHTHTGKTNNRWPFAVQSSSVCFFQYKVNCELVKTLPSVTFHLGGQEYELSHEDYILWVSAGRKLGRVTLNTNVSM